MSNSQPVWPGQHKPIVQLQSSRELCSACAASPLKGFRCTYRAPCIKKAARSPAQTHTHLLCPYRHSRQSSALPHCHGQSITETRLWNNPSSVLRATATPQENSWGLSPAAGVIRGGRGTTCGETQHGSPGSLLMKVKREKIPVVFLLFFAVWCLWWLFWNTDVKRLWVLHLSQHLK